MALKNTSTILLSIVSTFSWITSCTSCIRAEKPANVLFFFIDDLRPNLGCYGDTYSVSPNIDKLANSGITFTHAYCQQAVCNPSRTSLLTGLRPDETGVTDLETHFRDQVPEVTTLPQIFKNNGYLSLGAGKVYHATPFIVDSLSWSRPIPEYEVRSYRLPENQVGNRKQNAAEAADVSDWDYSDGKIAQTAIQYLEEAKAGSKPFFISVGFNKPHAPFCAPKKYWELYENINFKIANRNRPEGSPDLAFHNWEEIRGYRDIPKTGPMPAEKEQELWHGYYACISYVDALVGKVMDKLEELDLAKNTIVVLWGDHGYHLGEQDTWGKSTNFELDARVPLIISSHDLRSKGEKCNAIVEMVDIYPTLIDLCSIKKESPLSGISLKTLLNNPSQNWDYAAYHQFIRPYEALRNHSPSHMGYSIRTRDWRCTYWYDLKTNKVVEKELYFIAETCYETENLSGIETYAQIENKLAIMLENYKNGKYFKVSMPLE